MKFSLSYRLFSVVLSFLVLLSTLSLTIEKHFCGGNLVDIAVFTKGHKCCSENAKENNLEVAKKSCCKNETDVVEGQDNIIIKTVDYSNTIKKQVLYTYAYTYVNLYLSLPKQVIPHKDYSPPLLVRDIQILDETFLI